jgi:hypothetical protein
MVSNQVIANFTAGDLDPTDWATFAEVKRFQCKDSITIWHLFNGGRMYDPILSSSARLSYPLDFFTTNQALSHAAVATASGPGWDCPAVPNDPGAGTNLRVYSTDPDDTGSFVIYPNKAGSFDRMKFSLARHRSGVFQTPVNSYLAPATPTGEGGMFPPMGYGATPLANDVESCPNVAIPSGFHWVKVWLFRATLPGRSYKVSNQLMQVGSVSCNPGVYPGTNNGVFEDCNTGGGGRTFANAPLADRILGTNMCVSITGVGSNADDRYTAGADFWTPNQVGAAYRCGSPFVQDPLGLCSTGVPHDDGTKTPFTDMTLDRENRFSFLFVVTPASITSIQMRDSNHTTARKYYPRRFMNSSDCAADDWRNCDPSRLITYGLKLHDIAQSGDPAGDDQSRPGIFPVCALQAD